MDTYLPGDIASPLQVMIYHPIRDIWFYLLAGAVLAALAGYAFQYRKTPAARYWVLSLSLRAIFLLALVMVTVSPALADKVFWVKIQQMSALLIIPTFLLFVVNIAGQKGRLARTVVSALVAVTVFCTLALLTTGWHGWFWRGVVWDGLTFGIVRGPIYWAVMGIAYFQFLLVSVLCVIWARRASGLRRWQIAALPADPLLSLAGHILWAIDQQAGVIPPLPLAFLLSGLAWTWIFFRLRVLSLMLLAESTVIGNIDDSLIITDDQDYIMELNPSARRRFGDKAPTLIGRPFREVFASWPAMTALLDIRAAAEGEIRLEGSGDYSYHVTPLTGWGNINIGKAIVLHDTTELKQVQAQIVEQQKALSIMTERDRLGRELHDGAGQLWGYINMQVEAARSLLAKNEPAQVDTVLERLAGVTRDVHVDIRESIAGLRTATGEKHGLWRTLADYLQWYRQNNNIDAELVVDEGLIAGRLPPTAEAQLLRIVQEALTNVRKHAGARHVKVVARRHGDMAEIRVEDDGRGFDPVQAVGKKGSYGLRIMEERTEESGGRLSVESAPNAGTAVVITLPLAQRGG
ncbi:MAG: histidine kinase N-terminal 7TM domain-containing protein [Sporomusaceae bacterium]|nr:histidine kinase N-terminal 7TM domain-containing protein [Sporomusaceae bacterium]